MDRETGRSKGFGFVEMDEADAINAISALDGKEVDGRNLRVNKAEPKKPVQMPSNARPFTSQLLMYGSMRAV